MAMSSKSVLLWLTMVMDQVFKLALQLLVDQMLTA